MNQKFYALPQEKQDRIWNGALKVFSKCDYKNASTIEIAREADISKALLFHYFKNKKELYLSVYRYCIATVMSELGRNKPEEEHDFFNLLQFSQNRKSEIMSHHRYIFEFLIKAFCEEDEKIYRELQENQQPVVESSIAVFLRTVDQSKFRDGVDIGLLLKLLIWCGDGCMREKFRQSVIDPQEINREFAEILEMLRKYLYKESVQ